MNEKNDRNISNGNMVIHWSLFLPVFLAIEFGHLVSSFILQFLMGWGSKFRTTKCRTTDISKFQNCVCKNNDSIILCSNLIFHFL